MERRPERGDGAMRRVAAVFVLLLASTGGATAHTSGTTGYARISVHGQTVRYSLSLGAETLGVAPGLDALPDLVAGKIAIAADGRACAPTPGTVIPPPPDRGTVVVVVDYACAAPVGELAVRDDLFDALGADYHTLASFERAGGGAEQFVFQPDRRETRVRIAAAGAESEPIRSSLGVGLAFVGLGIEHILLGFDHILFVIALILRGGRFASLLAIVTAFTIAHSITLALAVLEVVSIPARVVEPVIALSIAYVAMENMVMRHQASRRWAVSFVFGLVHGFGFAGALAELGLPRQGLVPALIGFNLGVELGQALIIGILLLPLLWLQRFAWRGRAVTAASAVLLVAGLALLVDRTLWPPS
jgi:hypothetical protein